MADVAASTTTVNTEIEVAAAGKKGTKMNKKTDRPKPAHPTTAVMVNNAIQNLKERGGSSLQAIKKYISATYKIDGEKFSPFIKKYLKASVAAGTLVQTKGKGASGSFKLASSAVTKKPTTTTTVSKPKKIAVKPALKPKGKVTEKKATTNGGAETRKSAPVKSATKTKRAAVVEKQKPVAQADKSKSPSKTKKTAKAPTKKPKSPKPKTTKSKVAKKKVSPKKK